MTRRMSMAAFVVLVTLGLLPGVASAQSPPPPTVGGVLLEQGDAPAVQGSSLASTGSNLVPAVIVAAILIAVGITLVMSVRRRRAEPTLA